MDTGLKRVAAGIVQVTDGSTGSGSLNAANINIGAHGTSTKLSVKDTTNGLISRDTAVSGAAGFEFAGWNGSGYNAVVLRASAAADLVLNTDGSVSFGKQATTAQSANFKTVTEAHTLTAAGTSTTTTAVFAANSAGLAADFRITTEITGCTSVQVGVSGDATRFGTFSTLTAGQTIAIGRIDNYTAQTGVLFTCVGGGGSFSAGAIRSTVRYVDATAATS